MLPSLAGSEGGGWEDRVYDQTGSWGGCWQRGASEECEGVGYEIGSIPGGC